MFFIKIEYKELFMIEISLDMAEKQNSGIFFCEFKTPKRIVESSSKFRLSEQSDHQ